MSALPYTALVAALRTANHDKPPLRVKVWTRALGTASPVEPTVGALLLGRAGGGPAVDTATVRELEVELHAMAPSARSIALALAAMLGTATEESAAVQRALSAIVAAASEVVGAAIPLSVAIDATLLQACRDAGAGFDGARFAADADRARELARRVARALGLSILGPRGLEDPETSARCLSELDPTRAAHEALRRAVEQSVRSKLPGV